jgi:hypothetical protein
LPAGTAIWILLRTNTVGPLASEASVTVFHRRRAGLGCDIRIESLAAFRTGVELAPLVADLAAFPNPQAWSIYLRRPLLELPPADVALLGTKLEPLAGDPFDHLQGYLTFVQKFVSARDAR